METCLNGFYNVMSCMRFPFFTFLISHGSFNWVWRSPWPHSSQAYLLKCVFIFGGDFLPRFSFLSLINGWEEKGA